MVLLEVCQGDPTFQMNLGRRRARAARFDGAGPGRSRRATAAIVRAPPRQARRRNASPATGPSCAPASLRARQDYEDYGFCFSLGDWNSDVFAIGVPLVSADRSRVLAFNCSGRVSVMTREKLMHDFGPKLVALRNSVYEKTKGRF